MKDLAICEAKAFAVSFDVAALISAAAGLGARAPVPCGRRSLKRDADAPAPLASRQAGTASASAASCAAATGESPLRARKRLHSMVSRLRPARKGR